jgi:decaprenylphospho-beta-D-ribofuranose 2-oxidase
VTPSKTTELSGWGRHPRVRARVVRPEMVSHVAPQVAEGVGGVIARGLGRSYGDASLPAEGGVAVLTERLSRFLSFDERTGLLTAEAGTTLGEVLETFLPRGWFPPVVPGTKFVTLGGCVAADVHGKNQHHAGTFGAHTTELTMRLADGSLVRCSPREDSELFRATVGGMGLTGFVADVSFRLARVETAHMLVRHQPSRDLEESLALLEDRALDDEYVVSWVDCLAEGPRLGRGVLMRGNHARPNEIKNNGSPLRLAPRRGPGLPFDLPAWALNRSTARAFNALYFRRQASKTSHFITGIESFFFPLDAVGGWNRAYGRGGFVQYQCVLPTAEARAGLRAMLEALGASRLPCFLAVLKRLGAEGAGLLSFPMPGYTLSLDLPVRGAALFDLLKRFDEIVLGRGGRVYLAKDARLDAETFRAMYARYPEWRRVKERVDPEGRFRSALSERLGINSPVNP